MNETQSKQKILELFDSQNMIQQKVNPNKYYKITGKIQNDPPIYHAYNKENRQ